MNERDYAQLGPYSDLPAALAGLRSRAGTSAQAEPESPRILRALGLGAEVEIASEIQVERSWEQGGLLGQELSWSVGYGPRTRAWLLRPADAGHAPLPGVLALHDHGAAKLYGKEKVARDEREPAPSLRAAHERAYGGVPFANRLAQRGYAVLVPDVFLWGSRRFPLEAMPERERLLAECAVARYRERGMPEDEARYDAAAELHEHGVEKLCRAMGTSIAALVSYEDRVALRLLASRPDVDPRRVAAVGLSGGGARAAYLTATSDALAAAVVVGMMSTYAALLDRHVSPHSWMLFPPGLAPEMDWPDVAACRAPRPLMVQYAEDDALFPLEGMRAADRAIAARYREAGAPDGYSGRFYPGPHRFDLAMQDDALAWLDEVLRG